MARAVQCLYLFLLMSICSNVSASAAHLLNDYPYNDIDEDHRGESDYSYGYGVNSPQTGDYKTQHEQRIGDVVRGSYSLIEPDGSKRIVEYTADPYNGFRAVVKKEPPPPTPLPSLPSPYVHRTIAEPISIPKYALPVPPSPRTNNIIKPNKIYGALQPYLLRSPYSRSYSLNTPPKYHNPFARFGYTYVY